MLKIQHIADGFHNSFSNHWRSAEKYLLDIFFAGKKLIYNYHKIMIRQYCQKRNKTKKYCISKSILQSVDQLILIKATLRRFVKLFLSE